MKEFFSIFSSIFSLLSSQPIDTISIANVNNWSRVGGLVFDQNNNLWITNSQVENPLFVNTINDEWYSFTMNQDIVNLYFDDLIIDDEEKKWGAGRSVHRG